MYSFYHKASDGADVFTHYYDADGDGKADYLIEYAYFEDLEFVTKEDIADNPNPDDPSSNTTKGDSESKIALAKQKGGGNWQGEVDFAKTPAGKELTAGGNGPVPVWNPGDDGGGGGSTTGHAPGMIVDKGKLQQGFIKGFEGMGGGFTFEPNGGSLSDQLKKPGGHSSGDGDGDDDEPPGSPRQGGELGPKPPIVNPPTVTTHAGGLFARHVSDPEDKQPGGPDTKQVQTSFVLLPPTTVDINLSGPSGEPSMQGGSFNWGSFGGQSNVAGPPAGAARTAR
jgi:hypothetical protein